MFDDCMNSKKRGDAGLGQAIGYFTAKGISVSLPLTDSQDYDLVVDLDIEGLKKVQVKTTSSKTETGTYKVALRVCGGNSKKNFVRKKADQIDYDYLFVLCDNGKMFFIPKADMKGVKTYVQLGKAYGRYEVVYGGSSSTG